MRWILSFHDRYSGWQKTIKNFKLLEVELFLTYCVALLSQRR
jgi:hypothetical protein